MILTQRVGVRVAVLVMVVLFAIVYTNFFVQFIPNDAGVYMVLESPPPTSRRIQPLVNTKPKIVIIVAYMHTGSTYTGALLHQHPGTYYEYESLRSLQMATKRGQMIRFLHEEARPPPEPEINRHVSEDLAASLVYNIATCNHSQLDVSTLSNFFFGERNEINKDMKQYIHCVAKGRKLISSPHSNLLKLSSVTDQDIIPCLHYLRQNCVPAKIRVAKYIRLSMSAALTASRKLDNVRIIHLVRDPRAMMDSQHRKNDMGVHNMSIFIERTTEMCQNIRDNLQLANKIKAELPGLIYPLRYEDMVDAPLEVAAEIFKFIDQEYTESDKAFVRRKSMSSKSNATVLAGVWRKHIKQEHLEVIDKHCDDLYDELGYIRLASLREVRNMETRSHKQTYELYNTR